MILACPANSSNPHYKPLSNNGECVPEMENGGIKQRSHNKGVEKDRSPQEQPIMIKDEFIYLKMYFVYPISWRARNELAASPKNAMVMISPANVITCPVFATPFMIASSAAYLL
jgi:hypothetical protein